MKIGDFLLLRLEEAGVQRLFGVPGADNLELLHQLLKVYLPTLIFRSRCRPPFSTP